jgi:hypothetical protein
MRDGVFPDRRGLPPRSSGVHQLVSRQVELTKDWTETFHTEFDQKWRGGILMAQAHFDLGPILSVADSNTYHFVVVEMRVLGFVGATPAIICRASLDGYSGPLNLELGALDVYSRLAVVARRRIDGGDRGSNEANYAPGTGPVVSFSTQLRLVTA